MWISFLIMGSGRWRGRICLGSISKVSGCRWSASRASSNRPPLDVPISIRTTYRAPEEERPYEDEVDENGYLLYLYRGTDPNHYQNQWLREVMEQGFPLLYLAGVAKGRYMPSVATIIEDHPASLSFGVLLVTMDVGSIGTLNAAAVDPVTRRHYLAMVQLRVGQARFRETVLDAYSSKCTLCRLQHRELLDAAHIVSYAEGGTHQVSNGMSMCKIHHAAYDADIVGVRPDGVADVRRDVLEETDGPMLRHGLQEVHGVRLLLPWSPALRPSVERLEKRWERFRGWGES
jgi:putative restriction endonuclease